MALSGENKMLRVELVSAKRYISRNADGSAVKAKSDVPWLQRFSDDGGEVIISGDARMRGKLLEQKALSDAGFIVFFPARQWNQLPVHAKAAMLIRCWPLILEYTQRSAKGKFYELPMSWNPTQMREVTPPKRKKPGRKRLPDEKPDNAVGRARLEADPLDTPDAA